MNEEKLDPYTKRQISLIKGEVEPATNEEYNYIQDHCNDVLPEEKPILPVEPDAQRPNDGKPLPDLPLQWWQKQD